MVIKKIRIWIGIGVFVALAIFASSALAAKEGLTVSPPTRNLSLAPGQTVESSIKLKNSGAMPVEVDIYTEGFNIKNEFYDQEFHHDGNPLAAENWLVIDQKKYLMQPGQEATVGYHIKVPANAEPGGHYVAIFAQTEPKAARGDVVEIKRLAHLLYIEVTGAISRTGQIDLLTGSFWPKRSPIASQLRLTNTGNTHYRVDGFVTLTNVLGSEVSRARVEGLLMPRTTRLFTTANEAPDWPGIYKQTAQISFPNGPPVQKTRWVLYLPPLYLYLLGGLLIVVIGTIIWRGRGCKSKPKAS